MPAYRVDDRMVILWPDHLEPTTHGDVFDTIDPERVSSATGILKHFRSRVASFHTDKNLSELGKQTRISEAAAGALHNLVTVAKKVSSLERKYEADAAAAIVIPKADVIETMYDIELARMARAEGKIPTALEHSSERMRLALVRAPVELSGIKPEVRERLRGSFVSHDKALELEHRSAALGAAREGVQRVIELMAPATTGMKPAEKSALFGEGWRMTPMAGTPMAA